MEKTEAQRELNARNTASVAAKVEELNQRVYDLNNVVMQQHTALVAMQERLNSLEQMLIIQKVRLTGLGPSVQGS
jgi:hypothetical protein